MLVIVGTMSFVRSRDFKPEKALSHLSKIKVHQVVVEIIDNHRKGVREISGTFVGCGCWGQGSEAGYQ